MYQLFSYPLYALWIHLQQRHLGVLNSWFVALQWTPRSGAATWPFTNVTNMNSALALTAALAMHLTSVLMPVVVLLHISWNRMLLVVKHQWVQQLTNTSQLKTQWCNRNEGHECKQRLLWWKSCKWTKNLARRKVTAAFDDLQLYFLSLLRLAMEHALNVNRMRLDAVAHSVKQFVYTQKRVV